MKRTAIIFAFGLIISLFMYDSPALRIPGVLQRISLCYLACAVVFLSLSGRPAVQFCVCAGLLAGYWILLTRVTVPGYGAGVLSPEGNLACYVDRAVLGSHIMAGGPCDPEGLLGTIPSVATALMGVLAGEWILSKKGHRPKAAGLVWAGVLVAAAGFFWSRWLPINKRIWTSSFALFAGGLALAGLGICYALVEEWGLRWWGKPFEIFGRNPLLAYFLSGLLYSIQGQSLRLRLCGLFGGLSPENASLAYTASYVLFSLAVMAILYRKKIFLKI